MHTCSNSSREERGDNDKNKKKEMIPVLKKLNK